MPDMMVVVAGSPVADSREVDHSLYTRELVMGALAVDPAWDIRALVMGVVGIGDSPAHNLNIILYRSFSF